MLPILHTYDTDTLFMYDNNHAMLCGCYLQNKTRREIDKNKCSNMHLTDREEE